MFVINLSEKLECRTTNQEIRGSIPGTFTIKKCELGLEWGHPVSSGQLGNLHVNVFISFGDYLFLLPIFPPSSQSQVVFSFL